MDLIEKLEKFVSEHPEAADAPTINLTGGTEFTTREILNELKREKETGIAIVDQEILEVKSNIERWMAEV